MRSVVRVLACVLVLFCAGPAAAAQAATSQASLTSVLSLNAARAGGASGALVVDLSAGQTLFSQRPGVRRMPASVEKLYTTSTALARFGATGTFSTTALATAPVQADGTLPGDLYIRGGGDPTFGGQAFVRKYYGAGATMEDLAGQVAAAGITRVVGRVIGDESRFDALRGGPSSHFGVSTDNEGQFTALAFDRGLNPSNGRFQPDPAAFAAAQLAVALRHAGVRVRAGGFAGTAPSDAQAVAHVTSPPMATLVRMTNTPSDNFFAETLLKALSASATGRGSTAGGAGVVLDRLQQDLFLRPQIVDGSGLSRGDRTSPAEIVALLRSERNDGPFVDSLAVPGRTGTLRRRMRGTAAAGRCHGKTGTLHDVSNLAGYCTAANGHLIAFAFLMNRISPVFAKGLQDRMTVALARYAG
ncbi:MAG: D-alanyl-D-alaninecarboxypeptidase/D-alanyl-D-alanine-endopeptidase [Solirubrobacterales bacterium]|nr:D-alanyl-D-alaninecarboxypeptidase/D-alanyl-D-alanine-endopeptidase [Solirubrobacterales bacterium]